MLIGKIFSAFSLLNPYPYLLNYSIFPFSMISHMIIIPLQAELTIAPPTAPVMIATIEAVPNPGIKRPDPPPNRNQDKKRFRGPSFRTSSRAYPIRMRAIFHVPGRGSLPGVFEPRSPAATSCSLVRSIADTPTWQAPRARGSSFGRFDANDRVGWMSRKRGRGWRAHSHTSLEETLEHTPAPRSCRLIVKRPCHIVCL